VLVLSVAAACGGSPSSVATTSTTPTATVATASTTPTAQGQSRQLIVLAELGDQPGIRLVTPGGQVVANHPFAFDQGPPQAVAGDRVFVTTLDGHLKAIGRDGTVEDLGPLGRCCSRIVPSPDGKRWLWATLDDNGGPEVTSQIHVAGIGLADRVLEVYTGNSELLRPYAWTAAGVFIEVARTGIGGYFPFGAPVGPIHRLDLDTGKATPLAAADGCTLGDVAHDGTIACFIGSDTATSLRLVAPNGGTKNIGLPRPQFTIPGEAWFDPSGTIVMAAGATGMGNGFLHPEPLTEEFTTYLVKLDGSLAQLGPAGLRPALGARSWLSSQQLVLWRPVGAAGGQPGLYVLDIDGHSNFIADQGIPVGVLS